MITYGTRPLDEAERAEIAQIQAQNGGKGEQLALALRVAAMWMVGAVAVALILSLLGQFLEKRGASSLLHDTLILVLGIYGGLFLFDATRKERLSTERNWLIKAVWCDDVLEGGLMEALQVEAQGVVIAEDWSEFAEPVYFLDLGDNTVLFLSGEYLREAVAEGAFPCTAFTLFRYPGETEIRSVACQGEPLNPQFTPDLDEAEDGYIPGDGEIFPASLTTLAEDLLRLEGVSGSE